MPETESALHKPYVCPHTRVELHSDGEFLRSLDGRVAFPIRAGVPRFLQFAPAENRETSERLTRLNALAREVGWRSALQEVHGERASMLRYVTDPTRCAFIDLLSLSPDRDVLEIGSGQGQFTATLARRCRTVSSLEVVAAQAEFTLERCRQEGATNVRVAAGGDDCRLPYASECFDVAVLNLVFEWCGSRSLEEDFSAAQFRLLEEVSRVLRPGGTLFLATKNRFALRYLLGGRDEHCFEMRFGSALPRPLTRTLVRRRGHERPGGVLYSHDALSGLLRRARFERTVSYWATPEMRYPERFIPTDGRSVRRARREGPLVQGERRATRLLMPLVPSAWVRYVAPGLAFVAKKPSREPAPSARDPSAARAEAERQRRPSDATELA